MKTLLTLLLLATAPLSGFAQTTLTLHNRFGDHMVLQQGKQTVLKGTAEADSTLQVDFAGETLNATADDNGEWSIELPVLETSTTPKQLVATATKDGKTESITLEDILVGEVWFCSGQSNMARTLARTSNGDAAAAILNLRFFTTADTTAKTPQKDVEGEWTECTEESSLAFSAVGYLFGKELAEKLDTPIGLISADWGGQPVESFTSFEAVEAVPSGKPLTEEWKQRQEKFDGERELAAYQKKLSEWQANEKKEAANPSGSKRPRRPKMAIEPLLQSGAPSAIYNQMVAPWTDYAIAGAIWYQGESNRYRAAQYADLFPAMISDWRKQWGNDPFPFYFVQLAAFKDLPEEPAGQSQWTEVQNSQRLTLDALENVGMAVANDIGDPEDIHPADKSGVAERLALLALGQTYGKDVGPVSGPLDQKSKIDGNAVVVEFTEIGSGLKTRDGGPVGGFTIAGSDQKFLPATAEITEDGKSVRISHPDISEPKGIRYAWRANPEDANLVNSVGLPTSAFRTDTFPLSTAGLNTLASVAQRKYAYSLPAQHERFRAAGWEPLFNGKNLDGWHNPYDFGKAEVIDGEIHLTSDKKFFLVTEKSYGDFSLQVDIHLPEGQANSGVMFRANVEPGKVFGYQAECDGSDRRWSGGLYDEGRRKWLWPSKSGNTGDESFLEHEEESQAHFQKPEVRNALKRNDWNTYKITCQGNRIQIHVNGVQTTNITDDLDQSGPIGIQHHGEDGAVYRFRRIILKEL